MNGFEYLPGQFLGAEMSTLNKRLIVNGFEPSDSEVVIKAKLKKAGVGMYKLIKIPITLVLVFNSCFLLEGDVSCKTYFHPGDKSKKNCGACYLSFDTHGEATAALEKIASKSDYFTKHLIVGWADPPFIPDLSSVILFSFFFFFSKFQNFLIIFRTF